VKAGARAILIGQGGDVRMEGMMGARATGGDGSIDVTPSQTAERVQASLFAALLRGEVAAMRKNVAKAEAQWRTRCDAEGYVDPPERLVVVRRRMEEATRMLAALNSRFPRVR
jgi:hypothetical protein